jgi:broad specificity phosphatase PhoE
MENSGIIYLVRHCATRNDEANYPILLGQGIDMGISPKGREHAEVLADYFGGKGIDAMYVSPMSRAVQTARIINEKCDADITFCVSLKEVDMGDWEGAEYAQVTRLDPDGFDAYLRDPGTNGYPNGENLSQVCRRALNFIETLAQKHPNQRIVIVTHKYVCRAVLAHLMSLPMYRVREIEQDPGCVNVIRVFRGNMELQAVNYTSNFELAEEEEEQCDSRSITPVTSE